MIRRAIDRDASRIAEISVFSKRMNYREIFHDDMVSFGEIQVYPLAKEYIEHPEILKEFYVDQGIGGKLLDFAVSRNCNSLWVLEKNTKAQHFYLQHGFTPSGVRQLEEGTEQFIIEMIR